MKTPSAARELARSLIAVCEAPGTPAAALLTRMNQSLGCMCGNAVEIRECLDVLAGCGLEDVRQLTLEPAAELPVLTGCNCSRLEAMAVAARPLQSGHALERFQQMVHAQHGRLDEWPAPTTGRDLSLVCSGFVESIDTEQLGLALIEMGAWRRRPGDSIDFSAGLQALVKPGSRGGLGSQCCGYSPGSRQELSSDCGVQFALLTGRLRNSCLWFWNESPAITDSPMDRP